MFKDLTGKTFNRLTVIERAGNSKDGHACWLCRCSCGNECVVSGRDLKNGHTKSCGCGGVCKTTHGMSNIKIYHNWQDIKNRCYNENCGCYDSYGGRGITMFAAWINDFQAFYDYVSTLEYFGESGYTLDRINVNGNYEPGNLRYATAKQQANNKRNNVKVSYNGEEMTLKEAAEKTGIRYGTLLQRHHKGLRDDELFHPDNLHIVTVEYKSEKMSLADAAKTSGLPYNTLKRRYHRGDRGERLFRPIQV